MRILIFFLIILIPVIAFSQAVPAKTGSKVTQYEGQLALDLHNQARKDVGSPSLKWSAELSKYAQEWADNLVKKGCKMEHRPHEGEFKQIHGENIFWGMGIEYSALDASKGWYGEIKDYKHGPINEKNWSVAGHYTQMVWKNTTHVGIGKAFCKGGETIIVANYDPAGNYMGQTAY